MIRFFNAFVKITAWPIQWFCFRTKVYYEEKAAQSRRIRGGAIVVCNHTSVFDYAVLLFVFFGRTLRTLMAEVLFRKKLLGAFLRAMGGIFVDRSSKNFSFLSECLAILKKDGVIGIFPESRLPRKDETPLLPFKTSAVYLAYRSGKPILPVYTNGSYFSPRRARVIVGKPFLVSEHWDDSLSEKENLAAVTELLRARVATLGRLLEEKRLEPPKNHVFYEFVRLTGALPLWLFLRPKRFYLSAEAKKHPKGGVLYMANHRSFFDPVIMLMAVWFRRLHSLATRELYPNDFLTWLFRQLHCIPVDKTDFRLSSFRLVEEELKAGCAIQIFPEGGLNRTGDPIGAFKTGMILMALRAGVPIVPVYIAPRQSILRRQKLAFGAPVALPACKGLPPMQEIERIATGLHETELKLKALTEKED